MRTKTAGALLGAGTTGGKYDADSEAGMDVNTNGDTLLNDIDPGNIVTGILVFDIPKSTKLATLQLHDSMFSDGVIVTVK